MATYYDWYVSKKLTALYFDTPCCCQYYSGYYCVYAPPDYYQEWYLDFTGLHGYGSGWYPFLPFNGYATNWSPTTTPYSESLDIVYWEVGGYGYALAFPAQEVP